jgi:hypothetical protein
VKTETITECPDLLIRRQTLAPGAATPWHVDAHTRFTVVLQGEALRIEFRDGDPPVDVAVQPGAAEWDAPEPRVHRAVNVGTTAFEEIVIYFRARR